MTHAPARSAAALLLLALFTTACEDATGPVDGIDAFQAALADFEALDEASRPDALASLQAIEGRADALRGAPSAASGASGAPAAAPLVSDAHLGATFVYDPERDEYVVDPDRTGAPADGVRFVLYELGGGGRPLPGEEIGYADVIDEGGGSAQDVALRLIVVEDDETVLDYRTTLDERDGRGALTVRGWVVGDRGVRLDFDVEAAGRGDLDGGELDVAFEMRIDQRDFSVVGDVHGARAGVEGEGEVDLTARHGDASIRLDASGANGAIDGTVFLNGDVFATATGAAAHPTLLGRGGEPVTGVELLALQRIMDGVEDAFDLLEDLVDPVDDLFLLGVVL